MNEPRGLARLFARKEIIDHIVDVKALLAYVKDSLVDGIDYDFSWGGATRKNLLKPGAEKVAVFMSLVMKPFIDQEASKEAGNDARTVHTVVYLIPYRYQEEGRLGARIEAYGPEHAEKAYMELAVAVGRGSCSLDETSRNGKHLINDHNKAVKMSKKRAFVDGVLTLGLSGQFTQDGEEVTKDVDPISPATQNQKTGSGSSGNGTTTAPGTTTDEAWDTVFDDAWALVNALPEGLPKERFTEAVAGHIANRDTEGLLAVITSLESQLRFKKEARK